MTDTMEMLAIKEGSSFFRVTLNAGNRITRGLEMMFDLRDSRASCRSTGRSSMGALALRPLCDRMPGFSFPITSTNNSGRVLARLTLERPVESRDVLSRRKVRSLLVILLPLQHGQQLNWSPPIKRHPWETASAGHPSKTRQYVVHRAAPVPRRPFDGWRRSLPLMAA